MEENIYWIWLTQIPYIGAVTIHKLLRTYGTPENIFNIDEKILTESKLLDKRQLESFIAHRNLDKAYRIRERCKAENIEILTSHNPFYLQKASCLDDAPSVLYYKGSLKHMKKTTGIVGARRCTADIRKKCIQITEEVLRQGNTVVSGLAKGIDACASTASVNAGIYTIAVLAHGLDMCYPSEHTLLMKKITENGLILSEYPPGIAPNRYHFPRRNRLISAWSDHLVVIAPGKKSGALITAEYAKRYGREVEIVME